MIKLIEGGTVNFIFGDRSAFDTLCYDAVTELKALYPHIRRIGFRRNYPEIRESSREFFMTGLEDSICPEGVARAGKASYIKRNEAMIRESRLCVFYYDEHYLPPRRAHRRALAEIQPKSGTDAAFRYAVEQKKLIINLYELCVQ